MMLEQLNRHMPRRKGGGEGGMRRKVRRGKRTFTHKNVSHIHKMVHRLKWETLTYKT